MNLFKRKPAIEEPRSIPFCGKPETHYHWTDTATPAGCPLCRMKRLEQSKREEEDAYINRLAKAIARELKEIL